MTTPEIRRGLHLPRLEGVTSVCLNNGQECSFKKWADACLFFVHTASRAHGPDSQTMQTSIVRVPGISRDLQGLPQDPHPSFWPVSSASPPKRNDKLARRRWHNGPVLTLLLCAFELGLPKTVKREREREREKGLAAIRIRNVSIEVRRLPPDV